MNKALVMIIAYNAEKHIGKVLSRIPQSLWTNNTYQTDVVVIDDCSKDDTIGAAKRWLDEHPIPLNVHLLRNPANQGYGGNQKVGYTYAIQNGYDAVVMLHGDGQYPPEKIPDMIAPLLSGEADSVFGSRMLNKKDALAGGMPRYKFIGNIVLTTFQNWTLGSKALSQIPFRHNSNVFHFDTDIIIQLVDNNMRIKEIPIPTHYGDEVCHVNGMKYAVDVLLSTLLSRVQKLGILYAPKYDYRAYTYPDKTSFKSTHTFALNEIQSGENVVYVSGDGGILIPELEKKGCRAIQCAPDIKAFPEGQCHVVLLLDILERLPDPEKFLSELHTYCLANNARVVVTTANIAFFVPRIMLMLGQFNYGKRGLLYTGNTRLFTLSSLRRVLASAGFNTVGTEGIPAPFPLAINSTFAANFFLKLNTLLIKLSKGVFAYQVALVARPRPTLEWLVDQAISHGTERTQK
jgi:glycosyltransferase involved in cell wall biosynthesis